MHIVCTSCARTGDSGELAVCSQFLKSVKARLKSPEIKGFKSYADKTVVNFDEGINGIIGPNGCGKSNTIDSIRCVINEQKISAFAESELGSVGFTAAVHVAQVALLEVSLMFENTKNLLPTEFSTVTMTVNFIRTVRASIA